MAVRAKVRVVSCGLLVACGGSPSTPAVSIAPPIPPTATSAVDPGAGPSNPPHITVTTEGDPYSWVSKRDGLPALSPDGAFVAYAYVEDDGGRGFPNLYVGVLPVGGDTEQTTTIFTSEDVAKEDPAQPKLPGLIADRVARMNAQLRGWWPMTTKVEENAMPDSPQTFTVGSLEVRYEAPKVVVSESGRQLLARTLGGGPASSDACDYTSHLHIASVDVRHRVLLAAVSFSAPPDWCATIDVFHAFRY